MSAAAPVPVIIAGAAGRMGRMLVTLAAGDPGLRLAGGLEVPGHRDLGSDIGRLAGIADAGVALTSELPAGRLDGTVLIEFTAPDPSLEHLRRAAEQGFAVVLGTTGFSAAQQQEIDALGGKVACVQAPNMSLGVTVLIGLVEEAARRLGAGFDIEVSEAHHRRKKDSPSGTALALARTTRSTSMASASASSCRTARRAATRSPRVRCAPRPGSAVAHPACIRCATCSAWRGPSSDRHHRASRHRRHHGRRLRPSDELR